MELDHRARELEYPFPQLRTFSALAVFQFSILNFQFAGGGEAGACGSHPTTAFPVPITVQYP